MTSFENLGLKSAEILRAKLFEKISGAVPSNKKYGAMPWAKRQIFFQAFEKNIVALLLNFSTYENFLGLSNIFELSITTGVSLDHL